MHPPSRARWIAAAALTSITLVAACSGGSGSKRATAPATTSATDATQSSTTIAPVTHTVNHTVYYAGFRLGMSVATLRSTDAGNRVLDIATTFSNDGTDPGAFEASVDLASAGNHYRLDQVATKLPNVSGQAQASGNLTFDVDDKFVLSDAVLTIGPPSHAQVVLPLGAAGALADLAPATFALSGTASTGPLRLDVKSGLPRADNPQDHP